MFCINTGRSGSHYLANILNNCSNVKAFHEPDPIMNGKPMVDYLKGDKSALLKLLDKKIEIIHQSVKKGEVYFETNHSFIKGFAWEIVNKFPHSEIAVIYLKRDVKAVVNSFFRIGTTPLNYNGKMWMFNPLMKSPETKVSLKFKLEYRILFFFNRFLKSKYNKFLFKFRKPKYFIEKEKDYLKWYVQETDLQAKKFIKKYPNVKCFEIDTNSLNVTEVYRTMFDFFGIEFLPKKSFYSKIGITTNLKVNSRK